MLKANTKSELIYNYSILLELSCTFLHVLARNVTYTPEQIINENIAIDSQFIYRNKTISCDSYSSFSFKIGRRKRKRNVS